MKARKTKFWIVLIVIMGLMSCSTKKSIYPLWPKGQVPNQKESKLEEEHQRTDILRISKVQEPTLEVFLPETSIATGKAFLIFPGGGYQILAYEWEGTEIAQFLNAHGIAGIVVKYRLPLEETQVDKHHVPLIDAQRAIRMVRANASDWGVEEDQIGIIGFSAGGHLAATLGTQYHKKVYQPMDDTDTFSARPDFMALIYPVITMGKGTHEGSRTNLLGDNPSEELIREYSNEQHIDENTPRTFLVHAMDDEAVPKENSEAFHALHSAKAREKSILYLYKDGGHGFSLAKETPNLNEWTRKLIEWTNSEKED